MGSRIPGYSPSLTWVTLALTLAPGAAVALAQQASSPAQVEQRLRPVPAQPSVGAPIQVPGAPAAPLPAEGEAVRFTLSGVDFDGNTALPQSRLQALAAPYLGRPVSLAEVNALAAQVTAAYRNAGYILVRAVVPPQRFGDGKLTIRIIEGYIDTVQIQGQPGGAARQLEAYGRRIKAARPLTRRVLERELLLASDLTGLSVRSVLTPSAAKPGAADLTLVVTRRAFEGYAAVDNRGSQYLGPVQVMGGLFFNDALGAGGRLGLSGVVTPNDGPDLAYGAVSLDQPLGGDGLRLFATASYSGTRPSQALRALDTQGEALNVEASLSYPLIRSRDLNLLLRGGFAWRDIRSENAVVVPLFDDHVRAMNLGAYANALDSWGGYSTVQATLTQGLSLLGATSRSAVDKSHATASGVFTRLDVEATHQQPVFDRVSLLVAAGGQTAFNGSLLASEQYSIGGYSYGRAFDPADATGDSALAARVELQWTPVTRLQLVSGVQPYAFYEHGQVWQAQPPLGTPTSETLVSAGLGLRFTLIGRINSDVQWANPLGPGLAHTSARHGRVFFSVNTNF